MPLRSCGAIESEYVKGRISFGLASIGKGVLLPPPPPPESYAGPYLIVEDIPSDATFDASYQRKTGFAGRYWVFYWDGTNIVYRSSADGETWTDPTILTSDAVDCRDISVFFKDSYVHVVKTRNVANNPLLYRRGLISGETITWEDWRTVKAAVSGETYAYPTICVDSEGYPWISYIKFLGGYVYAVEATAIDGSTWVSPTQMSTTSFGSGMRNTQILPLEGGKLYYIYSLAGETAKGKLYDGESWGSEEEITTVVVSGETLSASSESDRVHISYARTVDPRPIYYRQRTSEGWQSEEEVFEGDGYARSTSICMALETAYVWHIRGVTGGDEVLWLRRRVDGVWQTSQQPFGVVENLSDMSLNSFFNYLSGKIGVVWVNHDGDWVYDLRYGICY